MNLSIATVTAAKIAADYAEDELSSFSLPDGRGYPGVITLAVEDEMGDIWIEWEDGNGEHTFRADPDEQISVFVSGAVA